MSDADLLSELRTLGVHVDVDGGQLRYLAEAGSVPAELRARIEAQRSDLIEAVRRAGGAGAVLKQAPIVHGWPAAASSPGPRPGGSADLQRGEVCCAAVERDGVS